MTRIGATTDAPGEDCAWGARPGARFGLPRVVGLVCGLLATILLSGCVSTWTNLRETRAASWDLPFLAAGEEIPEPSSRTVQLLRLYELTEESDPDPQVQLEKFGQALAAEPTPEKVFAFAELAYLGGLRLEAEDEKRAFDLYINSVAHAYLYLFDDRFAQQRNAYDPQFRGACDLYNHSLERALRLISRHGGLHAGAHHQCNAGSQSIELSIHPQNPTWRGHEFDRFEFVSDYDVEGLSNHYQTFGLGVPLIAVRKAGSEESAVEKHYPPGLSVPMTAFLHLSPREPGAGGPRRAVLALHDPSLKEHVAVDGRRIPLESNLSTPLAYFLDNLGHSDLLLATGGLLWPEEAESSSGLYMLQPYQPDKIPVIMIHGLWSSPITWVQMFNDLFSDPAIRSRCQFWFYFYPTGKPPETSAADLRRQLAELRHHLDPQRHQPTLDSMVLIGHSMGGLIARMQTIDGGDQFWSQIATKPLNEVKAKPKVQAELVDKYFFRASPSVRRVVTIATPHQGAELSNSATQWFGRRFIELPRFLARSRDKLLRDNPGLFRDGKSTTTSIDALAPGAPLLSALAVSRPAPWVTYHNVVGRIEEDPWWFSPVSGESDGVVALASAQAIDAASEVVVPASHQGIESHPRTVLEVRRILLEHLRTVR